MKTALLLPLLLASYHAAPQFAQFIQTAQNLLPQAVNIAQQFAPGASQAYQAAQTALPQFSQQFQLVNQYAPQVLIHSHYFLYPHTSRGWVVSPIDRICQCLFSVKIICRSPDFPITTSQTKIWRGSIFGVLFIVVCLSVVRLD